MPEKSENHHGQIRELQERKKEIGSRLKDLGGKRLVEALTEQAGINGEIKDLEEQIDKTAPPGRLIGQQTLKDSANVGDRRKRGKRDKG